MISQNAIQFLLVSSTCFVNNMSVKCLLATLVIIDMTLSENVGWKSYLAENPVEFHDLPLQWVLKNTTLIPRWLSGIFVRNGPAQVRYIT